MRENNGFGTTKAILHKLDDIEIFPVTADQLDELEKGSNSDLFLDFGIALASIFASFLCSLIVLDFEKSPKAFVFFVIICTVTGILATLMFALWGLNRKNKHQLINKIRKQSVEGS